MKRLLEGTANGDGTITYQGSPVVPEISDVQRLRLEPGDKLVLTVKSHCSPEKMEQLTRHLRAAFDTDVRIVILTDDLSLSIVNEDGAA